MTSLVMISVLTRLNSTDIARKAKGKRPSALSDTDEEQQQDEHEVISSSDKPAKELPEYMFGKRRPELEEKCDEYPRVEFLQTVVKRQDSYKPTPVDADEITHLVLESEAATLQHGKTSVPTQVPREPVTSRSSAQEKIVDDEVFPLDMLYELVMLSAMQTKQDRGTLLARIHGKNARSPQAVTQKEPSSGRTFKESLVAEVHRQAKAARSEKSMYPGKTFDDKFKVEVNKIMDQERMGGIEFDTYTSDEEWNEHTEAEEDLDCEEALEKLAQLQIEPSSQDTQMGGEASEEGDSENKLDENFAEYLEEHRDAGYDGDEEAVGAVLETNGVFSGSPNRPPLMREPRMVEVGAEESDDKIAFDEET